MACYQGVIMDLRTIKNFKISNANIKEIRSAKQKIWSGDNWIWDFDFTKSQHGWMGLSWSSDGFEIENIKEFYLIKKENFIKNRTYHIEFDVERKNDNIDLFRIAIALNSNGYGQKVFNFNVPKKKEIFIISYTYTANQSEESNKQYLKFIHTKTGTKLKALRLKEV